MNQSGVTVVWDQPLAVDFDFHLDELRRSIRDVAPYASGALRRAFDDPESAELNTGRDMITISVRPPSAAWPYAAIQNFGGPERDVIIRPVRKKALSFIWHGSRVFFKKVTMRAYSIRGSHYVERGVEQWLKNKLGFKETWIRWKQRGERPGRPSAA